VDDYQDAREMYAESLGACGFSVAEAETGDEAVAKAFELLPDAIVMDLSLPGMDGWTPTRALKSDARTSAIPVIALTALVMKGDEERIREGGCEAYLSKPISVGKFIETIRHFLGNA